MERNFRALVVAAFLALLTTGASAQSGCGGQAVAGRVCGNPAAATGLPPLSTMTSLLARAFAGRERMGA